jgi:PAS domain S-box-containing protein
MYKAAPKFVLIFCVAASLALGLIKFFSPTLTNFNSGFLIIILLTCFVRRDYYTYIFCSLALAMIFLPSMLVLSSIRPIILTLLAQAAVVIITTSVVIFIKHLNRTLEYDRRQMNAMFENATEGIILSNSKGEIVLANPKARELFHYETEELIGKPIQMLVPLREQEKQDSNGENFYQDSSNRTMGGERELYAHRKNGELFPVEVSLSYYKQHKDYFLLAFIVDISQRKASALKLVTQKEQLEKVSSDMKKLNTELENKVGERTLILQEALQELERSQMELSEALNKEKELNEIKSRFVSMASHEFRTPLSTVLSSAALLSRYTLTEDQSKREKHIRRIKESVKHLNDLLEDFLNLGKLEEGRVFTQVKPFNVKEQVKDVLDEIKGMLKERQDMLLEYAGEEEFTTDNRLLKNILLNLLSNAIKFSEEGKNINVRIENFNNRLVVEVKDRGIGISKEDMQHMFSTFYRGRNAVNIQGTGLGLHIVKRYVNLLKGEIRLTSELNEGTTVHVVIPKSVRLEEMVTR